MSKSNEADLQRKEAIEKLLDEREELREKQRFHENEAITFNQKVDIITDQIATLQALTSDIT